MHVRIIFMTVYIIVGLDILPNTSGEDYINNWVKEPSSPALSLSIWSCCLFSFTYNVHTLIQCVDNFWSNPCIKEWLLVLIIPEPSVLTIFSIME